MKKSIYKSYEELPLFLNSDTVAKTLGIAPSSAYELMHEKDFPTLRIGSRSQQSQKYSFFHNLLLFNKLYVSSCTKDRRKAYASGAHGNTGSGKID